MRRRVSITTSLILAVVLLVTGCGGKNDTSSSKEKTGAEKAKKEEKKEIEGTLVETKYWSLAHSDDWTYDKEDDFVDGDEKSRIHIFIKDPDDAEKELVYVNVEAYINNPKRYRDNLKSIAPLEEIIIDKKISPEKMGGVEVYKKESTSQNIWYGRVPEANMSVKVVLGGDIKNEKAQELLDTLEFKIKDIKNIDPPWPWDGEPYIAQSKYEYMVGPNTIKSEQVVVDESIVVDDIFSPQLAISGDNIYILSDDKLKEYKLEGNKLTYTKDIELDKDYENLSYATDGTIFLSGFMRPFVGMKNGERAFTYDGVDRMAMHPSGKWGISYFTKGEVEKVTISDGSVKKQPMVFKEIKMIGSVDISEDRIFVTGSAVDNEKQAVFVYDLSGNLQMKYQPAEDAKEYLGSIQNIISTGKGFVGLDGNMRQLTFWNPKLEYIGRAEDSDLFGTNYPWISTGIKLSDGSILVGMTEERPDKSADELIIFRVSGF